MVSHTRKAFTLIELVVAITIVVILSAIGFVSYDSSVADTRDSRRINDMEGLKIGLKSHKQKEGNYPLPVNPFTITNS